MSDCNRTMEDVKTLFQSTWINREDPRDKRKLYDAWADTYEQDHIMMNYRSPQLAVDFLSEHFSGNPEEALVLDVACGSGWVAKEMAELGFKNFEGVDGSQGMLDLAAKTGLYKDLRQALLGPEPLPAQPGVFDVVILVGALMIGSAPVSVVRELCSAAKPGGFICMMRANHRGELNAKYTQDLKREIQLMEEEGLWTPVGTKQVDRYMEFPYLDTKGAEDQEDLVISGTVYLHKKSIL